MSIDQLDLAIEQLKVGSPSYARFAHILVDNIVELLAHHFCEHIIMQDSHGFIGAEPLYSRDQRAEALGQRFDKKVKFCKLAKGITQDEADAIMILHQYRNELYHSGVIHDAIAWDLAWYYHSIATELFVKLTTSSYYIVGQELSDAVKRHIGKDMWNFDYAKVVSSLNSARPVKKHKLSKVLADSAVAHVESVIESLDYIVGNNPNENTVSYTIRDIQLSDYLYNDPFSKTVWDRVKGQQDTRKASDFLESIWTPKYTSNPLPGFLKQADRIRNSGSDLNALKSFESFKKDFFYFSDLVRREEDMLNDYIQMQEDAYRDRGR
ncbi:hypothetical protein ACNFIC_21215 [Pseudomonas sp. NY15463]|uniref:hypothetical protein n=1 Tax=Pseudomonas sp. NY15463 TaxID=3400361 RepID=UPI003A8430AF